MEEITNEQQNISKVPKQLQAHVFKKGQSGNPNGRPVGSISLKEYARQMLSKMNDEERQEFLEGIDKKTIWEMSEGKAKQDTDVTSNGKTIQIVVPQAVKDSFNIDATDTETERSNTEQI